MISKYNNKGVTWIDLEDPSEEEFHYIIDLYSIPRVIEEEMRTRNKDVKTKLIAGFISTSFDFPRIPDTEEVFLGISRSGRQQILEVWRETEFQYAWLFPWESSLDKVPPIFGSMESDSLQFDRSEVDGLYWSMSFSFMEIK